MHSSKFYSDGEFTGIRKHPIWLQSTGQLRDFKTAPFWVLDEYRNWLDGNHVAHIHLFYRRISLERQIVFITELKKHGSRKSALECLRFGGCLIPCNHFRNEWLGNRPALNSERSEEQLPVLIASEVSPTGGNLYSRPHKKTLQSFADKWRASND